MGKTAEPNTPYCAAFPQGALSVGGKIYTTQNPPISYTLSGTTATISDAGGVIGTEDLSGALALESSTAASQGVNYCTGKPKAVLKWSGGSAETENTPISYTVTPGFRAGTEVSFSGQISYSPLAFPSHTAPPEKVIVAIDDSGTSYKFGVGSDFPTLSKFVGVDVPMDLGLTEYVVRISTGVRYAVYDEWIEQYLAPIESITFSFDGNLGDNSGTIKINFEYRNKITIYTLAVSDSTGIIATYEYSTEPTGFTVDCYDYDLKEVSYACEGECPGGTLFECKCPETNSLSCYGFNPDNPDVFEPLFVTQITG